MKKLSVWPQDKKIVAIDFDGTLTLRDNRIWCNNQYTNDIIEKNDVVVNWVLQNRDKMYLILWTCRCGDALETALKTCKQFGIEFDAVNENVVTFESSNKIMADIYIDDKSYSSCLGVIL